MSKIRETFERNLSITRKLTHEQIAAVKTMEELVRRTRDADDVQRIVVKTLNYLGYECILSGERNIGFQLGTDPSLNGNFNLGSLIVTNSEDASDNEKMFFEYYAGRAGLCLDNARLYHSLQETKNTLEGKISEIERIRGILAHEIRTPITVIQGMIRILEKQNITEDSKAKIFERINYAASQITDLGGLLDLQGTSREDLDKKAESLDLVGMWKKRSAFYGPYATENNFGIDLFIDTTEKGLYANRSVFSVIGGTLLGNSLAWTPEYTKVLQGLRNDSGYLEIRFENEKSIQKRNDAPGMGKGRGFPFVTEIVQKYNGNIEEYSSPRIQNTGYKEHTHYGKREGLKTSSDEIFGIEVKIPLKEITKD
jgi:signal transduction histidine kinase